MSNINFRKTAKGYAANFQRADGLGLETRYYRREEVRDAINGNDPDAWYIEGEITNAEVAIIERHALPYRVVA